LQEKLHMDGIGVLGERRRQRTRTAIDARQQETGRGADDRAGAAITRRLAAFGATLSGAGRGYAAALADLDRASGRLERAGGTFAASVGAIDPWDWLKYQFYGHGRGHDYGIEP
jgi:hypothetical protein